VSVIFTQTLLSIRQQTHLIGLTTPVTCVVDNPDMPSRIKRARRRPSENTRRGIESVSVAKGESIERVVFRGSRRAMSRRDLHVALEPIFRRWIRAACSWDGLALGDYRFVIFSMTVAPDSDVYVQFWSEPMEPVVWEVSSGVKES
jgi:hypothetical protein